jgi:hypothetical protein
MFRRFNEKPEGFAKSFPGGLTTGRKRPHNRAATAARFGLNDRTIQPQRPHDSASTTARFGPDDRTMPEDGEKR